MAAANPSGTATLGAINYTNSFFLVIFISLLLGLKRKEKNKLEK